MVSQGTPDGVSMCPSMGYISICVTKCFISKIIYMLGGFEFFRLMVPQSPLFLMVLDS